MGAVVFAGMMAPMLIRNIRSTANMRGCRDGGSDGAAAPQVPCQGPLLRDTLNDNQLNRIG